MLNLPALVCVYRLLHFIVCAGDMTPLEYAAWVTQFDEEPSPLTQAEKDDFLKSLKGELA